MTGRLDHRADASVRLSSSHRNGSDLGIRQQWLPLFDRYESTCYRAGHLS